MIEEQFRKTRIDWILVGVWRRCSSRSKKGRANMDLKGLTLLWPRKVLDRRQTLKFLKSLRLDISVLRRCDVPQPVLSYHISIVYPDLALTYSRSLILMRPAFK